MVYRIDVFNRQNELIKYRMTSDMENSRVIGCTWQMMRVGGCGNASIDIETTDFNFDLINQRDLVKIFYADEIEPRYTGFVIKRPKPFAVEKIGNYELAGLINQISTYPIVRTFENATIENILASILCNLVAGKTNIHLNRDKITGPDLSYIVERIRFEGTIVEAVNTLSIIAGNYEYGIDNTGEFYFRAPTETITEKFWLGINIDDISPDERTDGDGFATRLILRAIEKQIGGDFVQITVDAEQSIQDEYGIIPKVVNVPNVLSRDDLIRYGEALIQKTIIPEYSRSINITDTERLIQPIGHVEINFQEDASVHYEHPFESITYTINSENIIDIDIEMGNLAITLGEEQKKLLNNIDRMLLATKNAAGSTESGPLLLEQLRSAGEGFDLYNIFYDDFVKAPGDVESGITTSQLNIRGRQYPRCDIGSGVTHNQEKGQYEFGYGKSIESKIIPGQKTYDNFMVAISASAIAGTPASAAMGVISSSAIGTSTSLFDVGFMRDASDVDTGSQYFVPHNRLGDIVDTLCMFNAPVGHNSYRLRAKSNYNGAVLKSWAVVYGKNHPVDPLPGGFDKNHAVIATMLDTHPDPDRSFATDKDNFSLLERTRIVGGDNPDIDQLPCFLGD